MISNFCLLVEIIRFNSITELVLLGMNLESLTLFGYFANGNRYSLQYNYFLKQWNRSNVGSGSILPRL